MPTVLSTKRLSAVQKKHLLLANISVVDYDAVQIKALDAKVLTTCFENAIFTSQNAVRIAKAKNLSVKHAFCVGENTAKAATEIADEVKEVAENSKALAVNLIDHYSDCSFDFFCSKQRRDELPSALKRHDVVCKEHHLYESVINPKQFKNQFDAVLCFSPLGVKAYYQNNPYRPPAICIGPTTAEAANNFTSTYSTTKTTVDSVVVKTIKMLNNTI